MVLIRPRMYGSTERYMARTSSSPSFKSGMGISASVKFDSLGRPVGREARRNCRFVIVFYYASTVEYHLPHARTSVFREPHKVGSAVPLFPVAGCAPDVGRDALRFVL